MRVIVFDSSFLIEKFKMKEGLIMSKSLYEIYNLENNNNEGLLKILKNNLNELYSKNNKITTRLIDKDKNLPTKNALLKFLKKIIPSKNGIELIYDFMGLEIPKKQKNLSNRHKYSYQEIKEIYRKNNCELLITEEEYVDTSQKALFKCNCGEYYKRSISEFLNGRVLCSKCANKISSQMRSTPFEEIKQIYEKNNCKLLSDKSKYKNKWSQLNFQCSCGEKDVKSVYLFERYPRCHKCSKRLMTKENHYNWKGGISKERDIIKRSEEYKNWRQLVFEKDNYTCQCCGDNKGHNLQAHHIQNYSEYPELRFDVDNGTTLCEKCHNPAIKGSFHHMYGTHNNTKEQLEEYIKKP